MKKSDLNDIKNFHFKADKIYQRFRFDRPMAMLRRAARGENPDAYGGMIVSSEGFARVAFDEANKTLVLLTSKDGDNLRGIPEANGTLRPTKEGFERSYIIKAIRHPGYGAMLSHSDAQRLKSALISYNAKMRDRMSQRFALCGAYFGNDKSFFTNGRSVYELHGSTVNYFAPARRSHEHFVPAYSMQKPFINRIRSELYADGDISEAIDHIAKHWQKLASRMWDEEDLYKDESYYFFVKLFGSQIYNYPFSHIKELLISFLVATTVISFKDASIALAGGISIAGIHAFSEVIAKQAARRAESKTAAALARQKTNINDYSFSDDASIFYKEQTEENILKLCPKIDLQRHSPINFRYLSVEESQPLLLDHTELEDKIEPGSLKGYLVHAHQRGWSAQAMFLDERTMLEIYLGGLMRIMHQRPDGEIDIYAMHRPDVCVAEHLCMPDPYRSEFNDRIIRMTYDRNAKSFGDGFSDMRDISFDELMVEMKDRLFPDLGSKLNIHIRPPLEIQNYSYEAIHAHFNFERQATEKEDAGRYLSGKPAKYPHHKAIVV